MGEKEIALLKNQIEKPDEKKSDLEAWKNYTIILVARIFGEGNMRIKMGRDLNYDYSSWNLGDSTGIGKTFDPVKKQAREILEAIIAEPETPGTPVKKSKKRAALRIVEEELTGRQIKEIETILHSKENAKEEKIGKILINLEKE
jgi:hypothetical protein